MAQKYHLGDDGQPRPCDANIKCPKGGDAPHFTGDIKDARAWAEDQNAQAAGGSFAKKTARTNSAAADKKSATDEISVNKNSNGEPPEWTSTIITTFNPRESRRSVYRVDDYRVKTFTDENGDWQTVITPQLAEAKINTSEEKRGAISSIDYNVKEVDRTPSAYIRYDEKKGNYSAEIVDQNDEVENLGKSKNPEALKKKVASKLNPRGKVSKNNALEADKMSAYHRTFGPTFEKNEEVLAEYEKLNSDKEFTDLVDKESNVALYSTTQYHLKESAGSERRVNIPGDKPIHARSVSYEIEKTNDFIVHDNNGNTVTSDNPVFRGGDFKEAYSPERVMGLFQNDKGLSSGVVDVRNQYGDETAEETVTFFADLRNPQVGADAVRDYEPETRNKGEGIENIKARLKSITDIPQQTYKERSERTPNSEQANEDVHIRNSIAGAVDRYKKRAQDLLQKLEA